MSDFGLTFETQEEIDWFLNCMMLMSDRNYLEGKGYGETSREVIDDDEEDKTV